MVSAFYPLSKYIGRVMATTRQVVVEAKPIKGKFTFFKSF